MALMIHYAGILPLAGTVVAAAAGLAAARQAGRKLYQILVIASLVALLAAAALAMREGFDPAYVWLAMAMYFIAVAIGIKYSGEPEKLLKAAIALILVGWLVYWIPFVTLDYTLHEVYWNTSPGLPLWMRFAAAWSGGGGSLYLFATIAALGSLFLLRGSSGAERKNLLVAGLAAIIVIGVTAAALNDAFTRLPERPPSGAGLNPLLKSPWLYPHPLTTFGGYALLAVAAVGLLTGGMRRRSWIVYEIGWALLTVGIMLGAYWSYETFGWGGYWAWDPVETSELMVWLAATFLPHLAALAPSLVGFSSSYLVSSVFLAMYVTRTGLSPLHSFAAPGIGALVLLGSALLPLVYALYRLGISFDKGLGEAAKQLRRKTPYVVGMLVAVLSLLAASVYVYASLFVPSLLVAAGHEVSVPQMSAGIHYFHPVLYPLLIAMLAALPAVFLGEWLGWRGYAALLLTTAVFSTALGAAAYKRLIDLASMTPASTNAEMAFGLPWAAVAAGAALAYIYLKLRRGGRRVLARDRMIPMSLLHLGLAVVVIGVLLSGTYAFNDAYMRDMYLKPGQPLTVPGGAKIMLENYSFGISKDKVDIFTSYVMRSSVYFWAWRGLETLYGDLAQMVKLYSEGVQLFEHNKTIEFLANLSKKSPIDVNGTVEAEIPVNITMYSFSQNISSNMAPVYIGEARVVIRNPRIQVSFNVNQGNTPGANMTARVDVAVLADLLNITPVNTTEKLQPAKVGFHQFLVVEFKKPINITLPNGTVVGIRRAVVYSQALLAAGHGEPVNITSKGIVGRGPLLYVTGYIKGRGVDAKIPMPLPMSAAVYAMVQASPQAQQLLALLEKSSLYRLLENPKEILNLTVSRACLASPHGCFGYVAAPKTVPETAWLDLKLKIMTPHGSRDVKVRIRFEAYGEIQGIHGLVSKVIHPSLGLDDVYVVISPPTSEGVLDKLFGHAASAPGYHELLLYYLHEVFKELPPPKRLALTALMAAGYNIDVLRRLGGGQQALQYLEREIVNLYLTAEKFNPANSTIVKEGLYVQVKLIPGVRLVWAGAVVMALGAVYAAAQYYLASRRGQG